MGNYLPVLSRIAPIKRNLPYLAASAIVTRFIIGVVRVLQNHPSRQKDPKLSPNQKRQAMMERSFVEIIGTVGYMGCLHFGQDLVNMVCNAVYKPSGKDVLLSGEKQAELNKAINSGKDFKFKPGARFDASKINDLIKDAFFSKDSAHRAPGVDHDQALRHDLVARSLYGETVTNGNKTVLGPNADISTLKQKFFKQYENVLASKPEMERAFGKVLEHSEGLVRVARNNNVLATLGMATGVALSAAVGGTVIQKMCDGPVANTCKKFLDSNFKDGIAKPDAKTLPADPKSDPKSDTEKPSMTLVSPAPDLPARNLPAPQAPFPAAEYPVDGGHSLALSYAPMRPASPYYRMQTFPPMGGIL